MNDAPATPTVPWKPDATEAEAQVAFNALRDKYQVVWQAIVRGEEFTVDVRAVPLAGQHELEDALSAQCLMVWGRRPSFLQSEHEWKVIPPKEPPPQPTFCGSCGAALSLGVSSLRWQSPGKAVFKGESGWEHQCNARVPQAGYFTAECDTPYADDSVASGIYETARFVSWWEAAVRRVREGDTFRASDSGHLFAAEPGTNTPPACRQCGLSARAFILIPDQHKWRCPGEPAPAAATPLPVSLTPAAPAEPTPAKDPTPDADRTAGRSETAPIGGDARRGADPVRAQGGDAPGVAAGDPQLRSNREPTEVSSGGTGEPGTGAGAG